MKVIKVRMEDLPNESSLDYCRALIEEGTDPDSRLEVYRDKTLALIIKNIDVGSKTYINGLDFSKRPPSIDNE